MLDRPLPLVREDVEGVGGAIPPGPGLNSVQRGHLRFVSINKTASN